MQFLTMDYISGPWSQYAQYVEQNLSSTDPDLKWLCGSKIIRRNDYTNFSTLAIFLVFGLGGFLSGFVFVSRPL